MTTANQTMALMDIRGVFKKYEEFCRVILDGYVLIDLTGQILKANAHFAHLVGDTMKHILKVDCIDQLLQLYVNRKLVPFRELLSYKRVTRIDEIRGINKTRSDLNLIIGIYPIFDEKFTRRHIGSFIIIRDVTAEKHLYKIYETTRENSITDALTGIFTRRYFEEYMILMEEKAVCTLVDGRKGLSPCSMIMVDIDQFKRINDKYGHQAGDHVLTAIAQIMGSTLRKTDMICRYGGEEFVVVLPDTSSENAAIIGEQLRRAVEDSNIVIGEHEIPVTISCGVAEIDLRVQTYRKCIRHADRALYNSKENGRNRVSLYKYGCINEE
ncbi:MAG: sensor domain-containing diguanylate cyclase [Oligoflexales bacterium]|nr:sensor domain-containing diguanylate cyclase [Oligoflexales bacterium]